MIQKKMLLVILGIAGVLLLCILILFFWFTRSSSTQNNLPPVPTGNNLIPTPISIPPTSSLFTTPIQNSSSPTSYQNTTVNPTPQTNPPVVIDQSKNALLMQRITTRAPLSNADLQTKAVLIRSLQPDEVLYQAPNYRIDYVAAADVFQVEIQSVDYLTAKKDAVTYLTSQGFSMDAVCNLPVMFYLNFNIAQELQGKNIQFNPLAEGC